MPTVSPCVIFLASWIFDLSGGSRPLVNYCLLQSVFGSFSLILLSHCNALRFMDILSYRCVFALALILMRAAVEEAEAAEAALR